MNLARPRVLGPVVDAETRCVHYATMLGVIAIRFRCCGEFYPCHRAQASAARSGRIDGRAVAMLGKVAALDRHRGSTGTPERRTPGDRGIGLSSFAAAQLASDPVDDDAGSQPVPLMQRGQCAGREELVGQRDGHDALRDAAPQQCGCDRLEQAADDGVVLQRERHTGGVSSSRRTVSSSNGLIVRACTTATSMLCAARRSAACRARMVMRPLETKTTSLPGRMTFAFPSSNS